MHDTAMRFGAQFFRTYQPRPAAVIVDIGGQDVNGTLRDVAPADSRYIGVDFAVGKGVDVILDDPYHLPFDDGSADICVSSSVLEHSEFFWLLFLEMLRILKPDGLLYLNVPSNGNLHRYPVDCWRFYPDSGLALQNWARRSGLDTLLLESFTGRQGTDVWNDFVAVYVKDGAHRAAYPDRMIDHVPDHMNGYVAGRDALSRFTFATEDQEAKLGKRLRRRLHLAKPPQRDFTGIVAEFAKR